MPDNAEEFWRFSLALYARPGVSDACLAVQDRHGRDVILLLFAGWVGASGRGRLDAAALARAEAVQVPWRRRVVEPLRAARRSIKGMAEAAELYARAKALELAAEQGAHGRLAALAPAVDPARAPAQRQADAAANVTAYLGPAAAADAAPIFAALTALEADA